MKPRTAKVYSRNGCHLCEQAEELLRRYDFQVETVDVDQDPELKGRYGQCVPVVVIDGRERFRGRVSEVLLRRLTVD